MASRKFNITKSSGIKDQFDESKLRRSLERSGAASEVVNQILNEISDSLFEGISSHEIYKKAFFLLRSSSRPTAARYKLKKAILELGPTGFPFEKFVGEILRYQGFSISTGKIVKGLCISHEVDVVAEKEDQRYMVECKFHAEQSRHCDVKIPLYIHSRFRDIESASDQKEGHVKRFDQGWIFTNTRFTTDAMAYAKCAELMLVGWDYPRKGSLKELIDEAGLHPITCLTGLTKFEKRSLLETKVVLCRHLIEDTRLLGAAGIPHSRHRRILAEARGLCKFNG